MHTLRSRLEQFGLGKYAALFEQHGIDVDVLGDLSDADLEKLGIPMGDRRRITKAAAQIAATPELVARTSREAERRQLTVMFADLVDSTKLAARLDPEDMKEIIARYQKAVGDEVAHFGGYVAKPLGDGLLIYFGWPQAHEDDAARSVRAALAAVAAVRNLRLAAETPLAARIGIATGEVVVGDFAGTGVYEEGAVVGGAPNLAARLQAIAGENNVVVAEETRRLVGAQFALTDLGPRAIKGFDAPVRAWRVDGETVASRFDAMQGAHIGRFVGREHEMGMLLQRWRDARDGECQLVLITGEAGIGKSRLVAECMTRVATGARRIAYQSSPLHTNTALYPVARQLEALASFRPEDSAAEKLRKLDAALAMTPRRRPAFRFLAELMSLEIPDDGHREAVPVSVDEQRDAAFELLAMTIRSETAATPLAILVEDAHWLDATTLDFIERLLDFLRHSPAMVLVTYRPEFSPPWAQHANVGLLSLSRLGRRDARAMVEALSGEGDRLPTEVAEDIVAKGDGNPLFVQELTGTVLETARKSGERRIQIPATLRDALSERLDRLGSARETVQIAAALGREFTADVLAATLAVPEAELHATLERLISSDVVFQSSRTARRFSFRHALLQEAAYESMLRSRRREIHARIADVLTVRRPDMIDTEPEVLATHYALAGDAKRAAECWRKAGRLALGKSGYREAIGAFTNALPLLAVDEHGARADTHRAIALAYFAIGDHPSVRQHLEQAMADAEAAGDDVMVAEIAVQQGHDFVHYGGSLSDAARLCERALQIGIARGDEALAYGARFSLGQAHWISGDFPMAVKVLTANLPENLRDPQRVRDFGTAGSLVVDSMALLGASQAYMGAFGEAFPVLSRAAELATQGAFIISVAQYHLSRGHLQRGDATTALPLARASVRHATDAGLKFTLTWHESVLGHALALLGNFDEALPLLEKATRDSVNQPPTNIRACSFYADALLTRDAAHAREIAEAGVSAARALGHRAQEVEFLRVMASALASDFAAATGRANEALVLARCLGMRPEEGHSLRVLGDIQLRHGHEEAAGESHAAARAIYSQLQMPYWLARLE